MWFSHCPVGSTSLWQSSVRPWFLSLIKTGSYIAKAGLELTEHNTEFLIFLALPTVSWVIGRCYHAWFMWHWRFFPGLHECQANTIELTYIPSPLVMSWHVSHICSLAHPLWLTAALILFTLLTLCPARLPCSSSSTAHKTLYKE